MSLHQAPRFHAYFSHVEDRQVMLMACRSWERLSQLREGDVAEIDLSTMPIVSVTRDSQIETAIAVRESGAEVVVEVYRDDPKDAPTPINVDRYRVWERLPPHRDYTEMVNLASTEDNRNMRNFLEDHVFLVKDVVTCDHWLPDLPPRVKAIVGRGRTAS